MKRFMILLAIGLTASEKLDRSYLPPPGAKFSGGSPGTIQAPFELPKETYSTTGPLIADNGLPTLGDQRFEIDTNRGPTGFSKDTTKTPFTYYTNNAPTTTTSYAFSQTTTLRPIETFGTTVGPINPITGLPTQYSTPGNLGFPAYPGFQADPSFTQNKLPSAPSVVINGQPAMNGQTQYSPRNGQRQYQNQYPNTVIPENNIVSPGSIPQYPHQQDQYENVQETFIPSTGIPQGSTSYPQGSSNFQQGLINNSNKGSNLSNGPTPQVSIPGQQAENLQPEFNKNQYQQVIPSQQNLKNQELSKPISEDSINIYEPSSASSVMPKYFNQPGYSSTTPLPAVSSILPSTLDGLRRERPQAEIDRNAVIINFENVRTPNGYSYSYDTSNGIHADESGVIDNGTKAKGSYSYVGDDGKVYSITYTADENGFQPRGDHLPTSPPIPEAIQKVIEQAAREQDAGIIDDGSYDETKYGDKRYRGKVDRYNLPNRNEFGTNNKNIGASKEQNPISRVSDIVSNIQKGNTGLNLYKNDKSVSDDAKVIKPFVRITSENNPTLANEIYQKAPAVIGEEDTIHPSFGSKIQDSFSNGPSQSGAKSEETYSNKYVGTERNNNAPADFYNVQNQEITGDSRLTNRPGEITSTRFDDISGKERFTGIEKFPKGFKPLESSNIGKEPKSEPSFVEKETYNVFDNKRINSPITGQPDYNKPVYNVGIDDQEKDDGTGYTYNRPETTFGIDNFPTRFKGQQYSTTMPEQYRTSIKSTTLKPFMTPNVYSERTQSSTRKPFITSSPIIESSFTDYTDGNDYATKDRNDDRLSSPSGTEVKTISSSRPDLFKQSTPDRYSSSKQTRPGSKSDNIFLSPTPSYSSVTYTTQKPLKITSRFPPTIPSSTSRNMIVSSQVPFNSNFNTKSNAPGYSPENLVPGSLATSTTFGSRIPFANSTPQRYSTPINKPTSTTSPGFNLGSAPVRTETSYQYEPTGPLSSYGSDIGNSRPGFILSGPGMYSQVPLGSTYQPGYQYGPFTYPQTTSGPVNYQTGSQYEPASGFSTPGTISEAPASNSRTVYSPSFVTQRPGVTVDNFGRPINTDATYYSGFSSSQDSGLPSYKKDIVEKTPSDQGLTTGDVQGSEKLRGRPNPSYGTSDRVIGENFSGPKQPQRFDPETGYHY